MAERKTFEVTSNHGVFTVFADDGSVKQVELNDKAMLPSINKFNVEEWQKAYPDEDILSRLLVLTSSTSVTGIATSQKLPRRRMAMSLL